MTPTRNRLAAVLLAGCAALSLTACSTYDPSRAAAPVVSLKQDPAADKVRVPTLLPAETIEARFGERDATRWVALGLHGSPEVTQAALGVVEGALMVGQAEAAKFGNVGLGLSAGATDNSGSTHFRPYGRAGITADINVFDGGRSTLQADRERWVKRGSVHHAEDFMGRVAQAGMESETNLVMWSAVERGDRAFVRQMGDLLAKATRQAATSPTGATDVQEALAAVQKAEKLVVEAVHGQESARTGFKVLTGLTLPGDLRLPATDPAPVDVAAEIEKAKSHPSVLAIRGELQAAIHAALAIDAERNGSLNLRLTPALLAAAPGANLLTLGLLVLDYNATLLDGGLRDARWEGAVNRIDVALANLKSAERKAVGAVEDALSDLKAATATLAADNQIAKRQAATYAGKLQQYELGTAPIKAVIDAAFERRLAERQAIRSRYTADFAKIRVAHAQGVLLGRFGLVDFKEYAIDEVPLAEGDLLKAVRAAAKK